MSFSTFVYSLLREIRPRAHMRPPLARTGGISFLLSFSYLSSPSVHLAWAFCAHPRLRSPNHTRTPHTHDVLGPAAPDHYFLRSFALPALPLGPHPLHTFLDVPPTNIITLTCPHPLQLFSSPVSPTSFTKVRLKLRPWSSQILVAPLSVGSASPPSRRGRCLSSYCLHKMPQLSHWTGEGGRGVSRL